MKSISANLNVMIKACEKASKVIIRDFGEVEKLQVSKKGPNDFVTKTDKRVEKILIEELTKAKKNYSFLTEESGKIINNDKDKIWIIDPIDGTTNYLHGIPHFAISVALKIDDELKAVYHSKDTVCFFILKTRELRNKFIEETKGMNKSEREKVYELYNSK